MLQGKFKRTVAFAVGAWVAQACLTSSVVAQQQPKRGGTLLFGINSGDPPTYDCHQSTLFPIIHLLSPHYSNLLRIDLKNYPKVVGDLAESWTVVRRPEDLQLPPPLRRQIPRRLAVLCRGHQGNLRAHPQSAAGRRFGAPGPGRRHRHDRDARPAERDLPPEASQPRAALRFRQSVQLRLQRGKAQGESDVSRPQRAGHRAFQVR